MDREEAIKICSREKEYVQLHLNACSDGNGYVSPDGMIRAMDYVEALDMAISAFRAQQEQERNDPLTLDELREMDEEPAWFVSLYDGFASWGIVRVVEMSKVWFIAVAGAERAFGDLDGYGKTWLAYRRKVEEGTA